MSAGGRKTPVSGPVQVFAGHGFARHDPGNRELWPGQLGPGTRVQALAFSPDGRRLLSAGVDGTMRIWEVETGRELRRLSSPQGGHMPFADCAFSPDGRLALGARADCFFLWDAADGSEVARLEGQGRRARFSPDGRCLLVGSPEGDPPGARGRPGLTLLDVAAGKQLLRMQSPFILLAFEFSRTGGQALGACADGSVVRWSLATGAEAGRVALPIEEQGGRQVDWKGPAAFAPDGGSVFVTLTLTHDPPRYEDPHHEIVKVQRSRLLWMSLDSPAAVRVLTVQEDDKRLFHQPLFARSHQLLLAGSGGFYLWDVEGAPKGPPFGPEVRGQAVAVSPDARSVACDREDGRIELWALPGG